MGLEGEPRSSEGRAAQPQPQPQPGAGRGRARPTCSPFPPRRAALGHRPAPASPRRPSAAPLPSPPRPAPHRRRRRGGRAARSGKPGARPRRSRPCQGRRPAAAGGGTPPRRRRHRHHPPHPHRGCGLLRRREAAAGRGAVLLRTAIARLGLGALHGDKGLGRLPPRRRWGRLRRANSSQVLERAAGAGASGRPGAGAAHSRRRGARWGGRRGAEARRSPAALGLPSPGRPLPPASAGAHRLPRSKPFLGCWRPARLSAKTCPAGYPAVGTSSWTGGWRRAPLAQSQASSGSCPGEGRSSAGAHPHPYGRQCWCLGFIFVVVPLGARVTEEFLTRPCRVSSFVRSRTTCHFVL